MIFSYNDLLILKNIGSRIGSLFVMWRNNFDQMQNRFDQSQYPSCVRDFLDVFLKVRLIMNLKK